MDPIADASHWILRIVGGAAVAALAYVTFTYIEDFDLSQNIVIAGSLTLGVVASLFGWKAVKWAFSLFDDVF